MSEKTLSYGDLKNLTDAALRVLVQAVEQQPDHDASWHLRVCILREEQRRRGLL